MCVKFALIFFSMSIMASACQAPVDRQQSPNIIFVLADDMGYGDVSIFNPEGKIKTPNLDKMARQGMIFTDAHTSSSVCTPTRYGILTGRYNWRSRLKSGVLTGKSKALIPRTRTTVASMLQENDYRTAFIGKWHLGWNWAMKESVDTTGEGWNAIDFDIIDFTKPVTHSPNDLGFDYSYGHLGSLDMAPYVYVENGVITSIPDTSTVNTGKYSWWREGPTAGDFDHEDVTPNFFRRAIAYVDSSANKKHPFFLFLALPSPHTPILPTGKWKDKSGLNPYADFVMMIDSYMGKLLDQVRETGKEDNTIIIFTTDNGCSPAAGINEMKKMGHFPNSIYRGHKADIYEGGHRVPFIVKWPAAVEAGTINDRTICTTDFMATFSDIVGYSLEEDEGEDSFSFLPYLTQTEETSVLRESTIHHSISGSFAIRIGNWKLIMAPGSGGWSYPHPINDRDVIKSLPPVQLFDLSNDPGETSNLYSRFPSIGSTLMHSLKTTILDGRSTPGAIQSNDTIDFEWHQIAFLDTLK